MDNNFIEEAAHRAWWSLVIRGVLAIAVGILILARPLQTVAALALVVALWALMQGIVTMVHAFDVRRIAPHWWLMLLSGALGTCFGLAALYYYPALSLTFVIIWAVWWLAISGITWVAVALYERRTGMPWAWSMAWGVFSVVMAGVAFGNPPATLAALISLIAAFATAGGLLLLIAASRIRSAAGEITHDPHSHYPHAAAR